MMHDAERKRRDRWFMMEWIDLAYEGVCDGMGGSEYSRCYDAWVKAGCPVDPHQFIIEWQLDNARSPQQIAGIPLQAVIDQVWDKYVHESYDNLVVPTVVIARKERVTMKVTKVEAMDGGKGYTQPPTVELIGGEGQGAKVTALVRNGAVAGFKVEDGGDGYTSAPSVKLTGGGGSGASAVATIG